MVQAQFIYTKADGAVTITGYNGAGGDLTVPATIEGLPVTQIGPGAFQSKSNLTSVTLVGGVTVIGEAAFYGCVALANVQVSDTVTVIGDRVFSECSALAHVTLGNQVRIIGNYAFNDCKRLAGLTLPESTISIGNGAFQNCPRLTRVLIPDHVADIGSQAFQNCGGLTNVTFGSSVLTIGDEAFTYCRGLSDLTLPDHVSTLGERVFLGCSGLTNASLGKGVTSIGKDAFYGCFGLTRFLVGADNPSYVEVEGILLNKSQTLLIQYPGSKSGPAPVLPASLAAIGDHAFDGCFGLTRVVLPDNVRTIGEGAFALCAGLTSLAIPNGVTNLANYLFTDCYHLTNVTIPESVVSIGDEAFQRCFALDSVILPAALTTLGARVFENCFGLTRFTVEPGNPAYASVDGVLFDHTRTVLMRYPGRKTGSDYFVPDGVTQISDRAFESASELQRINIPNGVTSMGDGVFLDCTWLIDVRLPDGITSISSSAFASCSGLTNFTIPDSVVQIGDYAFDGCTGLTNLSIPAAVTNIGRSAFAYCTSLSRFTVEPGNLSYAVEEGVLFNRSRTRLIQYPAGKVLSEYVVPKGVGEIGDNAFGGSVELTGVTIPHSVTVIGFGVFNQCGRLAGISVAFDNSSYASAEGVLFDKSRQRLIQYPAAKAATVYAVPPGVTFIGPGAFTGCSQLNAVSMPDSVIHIDTFEGCTSLARVYFEGDAPSFWASVFFDAPATVYYLAGTDGWSATFDGHPTLSWNWSILTNDGGFGLSQGRMGFTLAGAPGVPLVAEACGDLSHPSWIPVGTSTCNADGLAQFSDPTLVGGPGRFYRFRPQ